MSRARALSRGRPLTLTMTSCTPGAGQRETALPGWPRSGTVSSDRERLSRGELVRQLEELRADGVGAGVAVERAAHLALRAQRLAALDPDGDVADRLVHPCW